MRIAICDDDEQQLAHLLGLVTEYQLSHGASGSCCPFHSGADLLCNLEGGEYDIVLLGAHMAGMDGVQVARELQERDENVKVIFVSASPLGSMEDGIGEHWMLHKPADASSLFPLLDRAKQELSLQEGQGFVLKGRKGVSRVFFARLEYVEVVNKTVFFHFIDGAVREVTAALSDFEGKLLARPEFVKCHRAYLVNLSYVQSLGSHCLITENGHNLPVSRQRRSQVQDAYMHFLHRAGQLPMPDVQAAVSSGKAGSRTSPWKILLVDDDVAARAVWADILRSHGCQVQMAGNGKDALKMAEGTWFDCVLLDVMIPGEDGFAICEKICKRLTHVPVIFLSCLTESDKQVEGFASGGIDYITKDTPAELFWAKVEARIKLFASAHTKVQYGPLCLDLARRRVLVAGEELFLTSVEFDMLWRLSEHAGRVFTPEEIFGMVFGGQPWDGGQMVQVHMSRLRRKLEKAWEGHPFIETVWGQGYRFVPVAG